MKTIVLGAVLAFATTTGAAKEIRFDKLPQKIQESFRQAHPNARAIEVDQEKEYGEALYEIEFKEDGQEYLAYYHVEDGSFFGYVRKVPPQLPQAVWDNIHKLFPGGEVEEAKMVVNTRGRPLAYEVAIKTNGKEWKAYFNADGSFIEKRRD